VINWKRSTKGRGRSHLAAASPNAAKKAEEEPGSDHAMSSEYCEAEQTLPTQEMNSGQETV
jgi:hypothetical protein